MAESVRWGYGDTIIEITDAPMPQKSIQGTPVAQQIQIPIADFDEIVKDYLSRREEFVTRKLVEGTLFDDDLSGF